MTMATPNTKPFAVTAYRGDYFTAFRCEGHESIVYGSGSDWMSQMANVTNHVKPWRRWHGNRQLAEFHARELVERLALAETAYES